MDEIETIVIDGEEYKALRMIQKKTDRTVLVPVLDMRLSEIIDSPTTVCCRKGGMKIKTVRPKYELVSSHTARRSCITNLYLGGRLSTGQIRCISGHADEESLKRYLCQSNEEEIRNIIKCCQRVI